MGKRIGPRQWVALKLFKKLRQIRRDEHILNTLFWECTLRCNLQCRHCGSDCRVDSALKDMPAKDFFRVLDNEITPNVNPNKVLVILSGGEVLVRRDLEEAGREVTKRGYKWGMVTNGMALTRERLYSLLAAGLSSVSVSFDGFEEEHNYIRRNPQSFTRALAALREIAQIDRLAYDAITCVTPAMLERLDEFKEFLIKEGIRHWRIFSIFPAGRASKDDSLHLNEEQFRRLMEFVRKTRKEQRIDLSYACEGFLGGYETEVRDHFYMCTAGVSVASIRVNGDISGCTSVRSNYTQGNIYRDNFWDVWQNRFTETVSSEWARKDGCKDCSLFRYCEGNGMHLYDEEKRLLICHHDRIIKL